MKLLAIETATEACSAALTLNGELSLRYQVKPRGHSELILGMLDELLAEAGMSLGQLDAMAFGRGPGSFTGVRIATGVVQGVAFAADLPVVPVSTLAALAQRAYRELGESRLLPAYDARMQELYWAAYQVNSSGLVELMDREAVVAVEKVPVPSGSEWYGIGSGWMSHGDQLLDYLGRDKLKGIEPAMLCSAQDIAILGENGFRQGRAVAPEQALPVYLRDNVATKKAC
ncbi:MAG: tRNA (adenosine(37)-N6)-threonylcarbamoyltransferase complex dimerization subunit type 1 TsaB [Gammaproteobacteria bacterium]|nr:tRNA (adenosine(37)-N6)-threonylcarbamoyltransferase complex dimerization subunit type 1 TsaB [Gammaproteobacteria bacterium]